jgi:hypothetical protein
MENENSALIRPLQKTDPEARLLHPAIGRALWDEGDKPHLAVTLHGDPAIRRYASVDAAWVQKEHVDDEIGDVVLDLTTDEPPPHSEPQKATLRWSSVSGVWSYERLGVLS